MRSGTQQAAPLQPTEPLIETQQPTGPRIETQQSTGPRIETQQPTGPRIETQQPNEPRIESQQPTGDLRGTLQTPRVGALLAAPLLITKNPRVGALLAAFLVLIVAMVGFLIFTPAVRAAQSINVADINLGTVGEDEFNDGYAFIPSHAIFWESDFAWRITISSYDPDLGISDDGTYIKPLSDLLWKLTDEETWLPMTQEEEELDWGTETGDGVIYVDFAVLLAWIKDVPGQYGTELIFTIESL